MKNEVHVNEILATYTKEEQEIIAFEMRFMAVQKLSALQYRAMFHQ